MPGAGAPRFVGLGWAPGASWCGALGAGGMELNEWELGAERAAAGRAPPFSCPPRVGGRGALRVPLGGCTVPLAAWSC